jgi:hypothetical protein
MGERRRQQRGWGLGFLLGGRKPRPEAPQGQERRREAAAAAARGSALLLQLSVRARQAAVQVTARLGGDERVPLQLGEQLHARL